MYLKKLNIKYFRCFKDEEKDYEVEFAPRVTILFGKNGSGKSTLIHSIHKALSFIFHKDRNANKTSTTLVSGFPDLKVEKYEKGDAVRNERTGLLFPYIKIKAVGSFLEVPLDWEMYASTTNKKWEPQKSGYTKALKSVMCKVEETDIFPFIAYYSDSFPHIPKAITTTRKQYELRNIGYLDWNKETACSVLWLERYKKTWEEWDRANRSIERERNALRNCKVLLQNKMINEKEYKEDILLHNEKLERAKNEREKYENEVNEIRNCLVSFSKGDTNYEVTDIFSSVYEEEGLCLETKQGNNPSLYKLPAGYKRMFYMVLDIAYRSYMLNKHTNPRGIVIIDEIDLHLHPELEQVVLERFMRTFPQLQFVVSTHSPLTLSSLETKTKKNVILQMKSDFSEVKVWHDIHGIDYNLMLEENMGVMKRKPSVQALFDKAWNFISNKDVDGAKNIVEKLEEMTPSDQSELIRLRSFIKRIETIGR